ncbi:hypothetical protein [Schinkia azotoformans]|uniref:hypothetical protein n=1 Tax=Schinkia azotoformans TaxID=1454 RepID=UPI002DB5C761|nr:hypothetical protein [Schinkia azotoformans]MEC1697776.1 hypothetical protein [Schinkia azotoformans]
MNNQQDSKTIENKKTKNKEKEIKVKYRYFLGEFTLEDYLLKEANRIIAKLK